MASPAMRSMTATKAAILFGPNAGHLLGRRDSTPVLSAEKRSLRLNLTPAIGRTYDGKSRRSCPLCNRKPHDGPAARRTAPGNDPAGAPVSRQEIQTAQRAW